jgi:hypothetical protein
MTWPSTDKLNNAKLVLELAVLVLLIAAMVVALTHDRPGAIKIGLAGK